MDVSEKARAFKLSRKRVGIAIKDVSGLLESNMVVGVERYEQVKRINAEALDEIAEEARILRSVKPETDRDAFASDRDLVLEYARFLKSVAKIGPRSVQMEVLIRTAHRISLFGELYLDSQVKREDAA